MERCDPLMLRLGLILLSLIAPMAWGADRSLVLAVASNSPITTLDAHDVRLLFLGHTVRVQGRTVIAIRNLTERTIDDIFLQSVVAMSATRYDRYTLRLALQQGRPRPVEINSAATLMRNLETNPLAVSYAWETDVRANPRLRILRVLWRE
jgi:hypothetical protein